MRLWYTKPAAEWNESLPLGNGRLGAMITGDPLREHFQLNEGTLVSGFPGYRDLPLDIRKQFSTVLDLIGHRDFAAADKVITKNWLGAAWACYQPLGDLYFDSANQTPVQNYSRTLDLHSATCTVSYQQGGVIYTRETFASNPDQVIACRFSADKPGSLNFTIRMSSLHPATVHADGAQMTIDGQLPSYVLRRTLEWVEQKGDTWKYPYIWDKEGHRLHHAGQVIYDGRGLHFDARLKVLNKGGTVTTVNNEIVVSGADEVVIVYSAASSYGGFNKPPVDAVARADEFLQAAAKSSYSDLLARHLKDYRNLFDRVSLDLGPQNPAATDERLKTPDPALAALYFQFGRYLMISSSREGDSR